MEIKHDIVSFNPDTGSIEVHYYSDSFPGGVVFNIDLPITDGQYPSNEEIEALIQHHNPVGQIVRAVTLQGVEPPASLLSMVKRDSRSIGQRSADDIRRTRNVLLAESDFTQLQDVPLNDAEKAAWAAYRQDLRDITNQTEFPESVIFPIPPSIEPR